MMKNIIDYFWTMDMLTIVHYVCLVLGNILGVALSVRFGVWLAVEHDIDEMLCDCIFLFMMLSLVLAWYFYVTFMEIEFGTEQGLGISSMTLICVVVMTWVYKTKQRKQSKI